MLDGFGLVKALGIKTSPNGKLIALTLEKPLKISLPFMPDLSIDGLQLKNDEGVLKVQAYLFRSPVKIPYTIPSEDGPQRLEFSVEGIGLVFQGEATYYFLDLTYPAYLGDDKYVYQVWIDANGNLVGSSPVEIKF